MKKLKTIGRKLAKNINKKPLLFFYGSLATLVLLIVVGNVIRKPAKEVKESEPAPKTVAMYQLDRSPRITVTGEIEKSGVVTIVALTSGVVQKINYREGATVARGGVLLRLASNYHGGNALSTQRQLAAVQYQQVLDTYDAQKDIIAKQKESAQKLEGQAADLRAITNESLQGTRDLISLNESILSKLDANLAVLEADPITNADLILATKQAKSQFLAAQNQSNNALNQAEYQSADDKNPAELSQLQRDIAVKQLDIQSKMLDVQKEVSRLQLSLARISEGMTTPAAPFRGVVQRIFVKEGEVVNPGTKLAIISQAQDDPVTVVAYVSRDIAQRVSPSVPATISVNEETISLNPQYISTDAVDTGLYAVYFTLPDEYVTKVTDKDHAKIELALADASTATVQTVPYVPIDAIHQTSTAAYVFIANDGKAAAKKVVLGTVFGSLVQVTGLSGHEDIILDRTVTEGTRIAPSK